MLKTQKMLRFGAAAGALMAGAGAAGDAHAGAFALREQSTTYQGSSYAGAASGTALSSMFWNPAAAAAATGINVESHAALIIGNSSIEATEFTVGGVSKLTLSNAKSGDIADPAVIPASYANYQVSDRLFLGLAINSNFGLVTKPDNTDWAGSTFAITGDLFSANINPNIAYKLTDTITVGAGLQLLYAQLKYSRNLTPSGPTGRIQTDDIGFGFTLGATWTPMPGTQIGLGYRSGIDVELEGKAKGALSGSVKGNEITLPELVSLGISHAVTDRLTLLGQVEWQNWERINELNFTGPSLPIPVGFELNWDQGWYFALGLEYLYRPNLTLRTGIGYELSPIDDTRGVFLPDNDRVWVSVGGTYKWSENISLDFAYTHIFVEDGPISDSKGTLAGQVELEAKAETSVDILSASFRYKLGGGRAALEPLK